jgi:hypothetical protein
VDIAMSNRSTMKPEPIPPSKIDKLFGALSISEIQRHLRQRQQQAEKLLKKRHKHVDAIEAIDAELARIRGGHRMTAVAREPSSNGRHPEGKPVKEIVQDILRESGKPMSFDEIMAAIRVRNYLTRKGTPPSKGSVTFTICKQNADLFRRVSRGVYELAKEDGNV